MKTKVLMVCLGNICRSPLAEGILQSKVDADTVFVDSAGTAGYHVGNPPDERSIAVAQKYGLSIGNQKCRNFSDVASLAETKEEASKVKLLLSEVELGIREVPDPYYGGDDGFENVYQMIDSACEAIVKKLN